MCLVGAALEEGKAAEGEDARRSVLSVNSADSMPSKCERKRLRQGAAAGGGDDDDVDILPVVVVGDFVAMGRV